MSGEKRAGKGLAPLRGKRIAIVMTSLCGGGHTSDWPQMDGAEPREKAPAAVYAKRIAVAVSILLFLGVLAFYKVRPVRLKAQEVHSIFIAVDLSSLERDLDAVATIEGQEAVEDAVKTLNSIKARFTPPWYDLGSRSISAWVFVYDEEGEMIDSIDIFEGDVLHTSFPECRIRFSEYDKLETLCEKYGEVHKSDG